LGRGNAAEATDPDDTDSSAFEFLLADWTDPIQDELARIAFQFRV
jgi:hypothetical protein